MPREPELYKDKIEISLDGRQVFYLFFGGAVIACLVFVLGVMVGRRVEARAHVDRGAATTAARDPLNALDQLDASGGSGMSFRSELAGGKTTSEVDEAVAAIEKQRAAAKAEAAKPPPKPEPAKAEPARAEAPKPEPPKAEPVAKPEPDPEPVPDKPAGKFTLQLSSFKEKVEAQSFLADMKIAGYRAYLVEAEVEGKGTFYRVRFGHYQTYEDAIEAKEDFENKMRKIAYVTRL